jgi:SAM-dependent methyltransferase
VLDTGTAYAPPVYHRLLYRLDAEVDGADLVPFDVPGVRPTVADLRELPFEDGEFDVTLCVSTLEHIGMDNEAYFDSAGEQIDEQGDLRALRELGRVTRRGGRVLVTVPGGPDESYGWLRQYSPEGFTRLAEAAGLRAERLDLYAHDPGVGWRHVPPEDLRERTFGAGVAAAAAVICAVLVK